MKLKIELTLGARGFEQAPREEAAAILRGIAANLVNDSMAGARVYDLEGNDIGRWRLIPEWSKEWSNSSTLRMVQR